MRFSFDGTKYLYLVGRGDLNVFEESLSACHAVARCTTKVTFTPRRANTVRPYGFDGILVISAHTVMTYDRLSAFSFDAKGAKEKANGQKHSRLEHERMARAQYSLFFPIFASASSSTGRADVKIKKLMSFGCPIPTLERAWWIIRIKLQKMRQILLI